MQCSRPVFNSMYNSVVFTTRDQHVNFTYKEYDPLEFNETSMDNNLTAILAYYAYLFIGMDLDTFSKKGGTDASQGGDYREQCTDFLRPWLEGIR